MTQILVILAQCVLIVILAFIWAGRDRKAAKRVSQIEPFLVLIGVFLLGAALTIGLKAGLNAIIYYVPSVLYEKWFWILTLFLEEFVKIAALICGLEAAGHKFNELSDGVIYTAFAALGFVFVENLIYLLPVSENFETFSALFFGRNLFSFAAHLFTSAFGVFYAFAYLYSCKRGRDRRVKPWRIFEHLKILWREFGILFFVWLPFSPFVSLWKFFSRGLKKLSIPEMLWSGFLLSFYLHVLYDLVLKFNNSVLNMVVLFLVGISVYALYYFFPKMEIAVK